MLWSLLLLYFSYSSLYEDQVFVQCFFHCILYYICRYGRNGVDEYKKNLTRLFDRFKQTLPDDCLLVWNATLPISKNARGGFLVPEVEFMNSSLRLDILEANFYANQVARF